MKILLLEDDYGRVEQFRKRIDELNENNNLDYELVHVETASEAIRKLVSNTFDLILLDHDLGGEVYVDVNREDTGSEVARWMNKNPDKIEKSIVITHTFNPAGAKNIVDLVPKCIYIPAIWMKDKFHKIIQAK